MPEANINDRASIEAIYPREVFRSDAARNSDAKAAVLHGVSIASEVSEGGAFALQRASRHVGEGDPLGDTLFLAPFLGDAYAAMEQTPAYGATKEKARGLEKVDRQDADYDAFIERVIAAASQARFKEAIGRHEERLRGFRGG
jgi:hypothetical protein